MTFEEKLKSGFVFFDGATGTYLQERGLSAGERPELWNINRPEETVRLHSLYLGAGSDVLTLNTFGANRLAFPEGEGLSYVDLIDAAFARADEAIASVGGKQRYKAFDIGPLGRLIEPFGDLPFDEAVGHFAESVRAAAKHRPDVILIETMSDTLEMKAAVLAAKENSDVPVIVTATYDSGGKTQCGADPYAVMPMLEGLGVIAGGMNCGTGPDVIPKLVPMLTGACSLPVMVSPNAGMPEIVNGRAVYRLTPSEFARDMTEAAKLGARIFGGCCGTTPEHISAMVSAVSELEPLPVRENGRCFVTSYARSVEIGRSPVMIGERINPTGKPKLKAALKAGDSETAVTLAAEQFAAGADILDVNVGVPGIDEKAALTALIGKIQASCPLPLEIDTSDPSAMEAALRAYNGRPLINSVNARQDVMDAVFPLAKKYGGALIALTIDENGIPDTAERRVAAAGRIYAEAEKYGIKKKDIIVDALTMTVGVDPEAAQITLGALSEIAAKGGRTALGVSNVSFGLPRRELINSVFLTMALTHGLSAAIVNPCDAAVSGAFRAFRALTGRDGDFKDYVAFCEEHPAAAQESIKTPGTSAGPSTEAYETPEGRLISAVTGGRSDEAKSLCAQLLKDRPPQDIINACIVPALEKTGDAYGAKRIFLPALLASANAAQAAFDVIREALKNEGTCADPKGRVLLATVSGDVHDIGKNIVRALLENSGFEVLDLGRDVPPEAVATAARDNGIRLVGLSALMTTTLPAMAQTVKLVHELSPGTKVMVGGAVLTAEYAAEIGADSYSRDAPGSVKYARSLFEGGAADTTEIKDESV
ncbi:MAG: homocysteine S-methyltransferase family protein [Clostridia bacterium]|nr:homocysteine S-methyltransferase family protein [Clostridia bacterium]